MLRPRSVGRRRFKEPGSAFDGARVPVRCKGPEREAPQRGGGVPHPARGSRRQPGGSDGAGPFALCAAGNPGCGARGGQGPRSKKGGAPRIFIPKGSPRCCEGALVGRLLLLTLAVV